MKDLLLFLPFIFSLLITTSCHKSEPANLNNCTVAAASKGLSNAFAEFEVAIGNYTDDPSAENDEAYKQKAQDYLDVLKHFENCAGVGNTQEWLEIIRETEAEVAMIQC